MLIFSWGFLGHAQNSIRLPIWPASQDSTTIIGLSTNLWQKEDLHSVYTYGINLELAGATKFYDYGHIYPFFLNDSCYDYFIDFPVSENVNGIAMGIWGYAGNTKVNGLLLSPSVSAVASSNGMTISGFNSSLKHAGVQVSYIGNSSFNFYGLQTSLLLNSNTGTTKGCQISVFNFSSKMKGLQIGIVNKATDLKGIQIGILNINENRIMPFINW